MQRQECVNLAPDKSKKGERSEECFIISLEGKSDHLNAGVVNHGMQQRITHTAGVTISPTDSRCGTSGELVK